MSCSGECSVSNFGLSHPSPEQFVNSQWKIPQVVYLLYRIVVSIFFLVWVVLSGVIEYDWYNDEADRVKWFIYLTNWMFFTLTVETTVEMIVVSVSIYQKQQDVDYSSMPWYIKVMWVFYNVATTISIVTCLAYWVLLYPNTGSCSSNQVLNECGSPATATCSEPSPVAAQVCVLRCECPASLPVWYDGECISLADCPNTTLATSAYQLKKVYLPHYIDYVTHASPLAYVVINLFITALPVRIQHFWHGLVFAVIYILFSLIYDLTGGTNALDKTYIYSPLDWSEPDTAALYACIVGIVVPIICWLLVYALYWARIALAKCCKSHDHIKKKDSTTELNCDIALTTREKTDKSFM